MLLWVTRFTTDVLATGIAQASSQFASQFISTTNTTALTTAAPVIANPFGYSEFNLVPFQYLAAEPPTTAGTIYVSFVFAQKETFSKTDCKTGITAAHHLHLLHHARVSNDDDAFAPAPHLPFRNAAHRRFAFDSVVLGVPLLQPRHARVSRADDHQIRTRRVPHLLGAELGQWSFFSRVVNSTLCLLMCCPLFR